MLRLYEDLAKHCGTAALGCGSAQGQSGEGARDTDIFNASRLEGH